MTILSVIFLAVYSYQVLGRPSARMNAIAILVQNILWGLFALHYALTFCLAPRKKQWFIHHFFDLLVVILPFFRPLRIIFALAPLRVLHHANSTSFRLTVLAYTMCISLLVFYVGPLAMLEAERGAQGSRIQTFGEALWWTMTTVTAVGYGDYAPVTHRGRVIAVILMFCGVALVGVISALLSSWIINEENVGKERENRLMRERVHKLQARLERIDTSLSQISSALQIPGSPSVSSPQSLSHSVHVVSPKYRPTHLDESRSKE